MIYIVELSKGNTYELKDPSTATNFAEIALTHRQEKNGSHCYKD